METVLDGLKIGVAVILVCALITSSFFLINKGIDIFDERTAAIEDTVKASAELSVSQFRNNEVGTDMLMDAVNNYQGLLEIRIQTGAMQQARMLGGECVGFRDTSASGFSDSNPDGHVNVWLSQELREYYIYPMSELDVVAGTIDTLTWSSSTKENTSHNLTVKQNNDRLYVTSPFYIDPDALWYSDIVYNSGDVIGISFTQKV